MKKKVDVAGLYWVKFQGKWTVGEHDGSRSRYPWLLLGSDEIYEESEFAEVGAKLEPPR